MDKCPYCGGDESKCDFDCYTDCCSEMDRQRSDPCPYSEAEIERSQRRLAAILGEKYEP